MAAAAIRDELIGRSVQVGQLAEGRPTVFSDQHDIAAQRARPTRERR